MVMEKLRKEMGEQGAEGTDGGAVGEVQGERVSLSVEG
jgi:hypothetical protein